MYYRVAIHRPAEHRDQPSTWQWASTPLSSLPTLVEFLRRYGALRLDRLRVFSAASREDLEEQLVLENQELVSLSVTAAHFLQERQLSFPLGTRTLPADEKGGQEQRAALAVPPHPAVNERSREENGLVGQELSALERRRLELELGPGGDHDVPYRFVLPASLPPVLAWIRLLACIQRGELPREGVSIDTTTSTQRT